MYNVLLLSFPIHKIHTMCCIFPHVYTRAKTVFCYFPPNHFRLFLGSPIASVWVLRTCCVRVSVCQYVPLLSLCCMRAIQCGNLAATDPATVCEWVSQRIEQTLRFCVWVCLFRAILNTIGIVKYLEGGVFIHDCCCCTEQWCKNKHSQRSVYCFERLRIRHCRATTVWIQIFLRDIPTFSMSWRTDKHTDDVCVCVSASASEWREFKRSSVAHSNLVLFSTMYYGKYVTENILLFMYFIDVIHILDRIAHSFMRIDKNVECFVLVCLF